MRESSPKAEPDKRTKCPEDDRFYCNECCEDLSERVCAALHEEGVNVFTLFRRKRSPRDESIRRRIAVECSNCDPPTAVVFNASLDDCKRLGLWGEGSADR